jgi:hypothetical protein
MDTAKDVKRAEIELAQLKLQAQKLKAQISELMKDAEVKIKPISERLLEIETKIQEHNRHHVGQLTIMEWKSPKNGSLYLRGAFYYYKPGATRQSIGTVHIGKVDAFPLGKTDLKAIELGIIKANKYIKANGYLMSK